MNACPGFDYLLMIPHLRVQNANAISSPFTHGFPSMTAFLGLMWALERRARAAGMDLAFKAVGVVCHGYQEQITRDRFVKAFHLTRNPASKDGSTAAIVEEGRIHLELSLAFAVRSTRWSREPDARDLDVFAVAELAASMRIAGGTVLPPAEPRRRRYQPWVVDLTGSDPDRRREFGIARFRLLPGFALVSREDRLEERLAMLQAEAPDATRLDAWLSLSRINWRFVPGQSGEKGEWINDRRGQGWVVPIPVGYGALRDLLAGGSVANARDTTTPFRFVESLFSIGEWISPHRLRSPQQFLWYARAQTDRDAYLCLNDYCAEAEPLDQLYEFD